MKAIWRSWSQPSISSELPLRKQPITRVRWQIYRFSLSITLLVRIRPTVHWKIAVSQHFLNAILHLLGVLFQFHEVQFLYRGFRFLANGFLTLLGMDRLPIVSPLSKVLQRTHCGKSECYTVSIWLQEILRLCSPAYQDTCLRLPA